MLTGSRNFWIVLIACGLSHLLPVVNGGDIRAIVANIDERIERSRKRDAILSFALPNGEKLPAGVNVHIELKNHAFLFGGMIGGFHSSENQSENEVYRQRFADSFNFATLLFIWEEYEPQPNQTKMANRMEVARWCRQRGIAMKGHCLFWNLEPSWIRRLASRESEPFLWSRISREVAQFRGIVDSWDVVNEATDSLYHARAKSANAQLNVLNRLGVPGSVVKSFALARAANQESTLLINDFETTARREKSLQACLDQGADFDVIGIQSHMHQGYWGAEKIWGVCERFAKFGKPLHFTELTILSGRLMSKQDDDWSTRRDGWASTSQREATQAAQVRETYRLLFSHPAVEAITWWDLSDRYAWMGAPGGLLRADFSPKPAYYVVKDHIKKAWHTNIKKPTDANGQIQTRGFYGEYLAKVSKGGRVYQGRFDLERNGNTTIQVQLE